MNNEKKTFNNNFNIKIYFLLGLFVIDIVMNSFTQFISFGNYNTIEEYNLQITLIDGFISYLLFIVQLLVQMLMLFIALSLFMNTFYFQLGMVGTVCSRFKFSFILIGLYPTSFIFERVLRLLLLDAMKSDKTINDVYIWNMVIYRIAYFLKFLIGFVYYVFILDSLMEIGKEKYYKPEQSNEKFKL